MPSEARYPMLTTLGSSETQVVLIPYPVSAITVLTQLTGGATAGALSAPLPRHGPLRLAQIPNCLNSPTSNFSFLKV